MDRDLLYTFRDKICDKELIPHIFKNRFGCNKWNTICSAMDWLEVSIDGIDMNSLSRENDNDSSIRMITFLSCVDVMWEAVQQLHRVLFDTNKIPMKDDKSVFKQTVSDNVYFKIIRACFAAHPVNLQQVYPDDNVNERWFASWSGGTFSEKDFSVILYSNNPEKDSRFFEISFDEVYSFAEKRYQYLTVIMNQVDTICSNYLCSYRNEVINIVSDDIVSIVNVLLKENENRFANDYYNYELQKIRRVFEIPHQLSKKNDSVISRYRNALKLELDEIRIKLQNMELDNLENQVEDNMPTELIYSFSKLSEAVWLEKHCSIFNYVVSTIQNYFWDIVDIDENMSQDEVYVITCAAAYVTKHKCANDI